MTIDLKHYTHTHRKTKKVFQGVESTSTRQILHWNLLWTGYFCTIIVRASFCLCRTFHHRDPTTFLPHSTSRSWSGTRRVPGQTAGSSDAGLFSPHSLGSRRLGTYTSWRVTRTTQVRTIWSYLATVVTAVRLTKMDAKNSSAVELVPPAWTLLGQWTCPLDSLNPKASGHVYVVEVIQGGGGGG